MSEGQKTLSAEQVEAFYHDLFVADQVSDFMTLAGSIEIDGVVVDVGGGCGYFVRAIQQRLGHRVRVLDADVRSVEACRRAGTDAVQGDALQAAAQGDESIACFNLILHHLVGANDATTRRLQERALSVWREHIGSVFVNEYIYESPWKGGLPGRLIFLVTRSQTLSLIGRIASQFVPSLKANTFGVGVRFRTHAQWRALFESQQYEVVGHTFGKEEEVS